MAKVLSDHNCEGQAEQLFLVLKQPFYAEIADVALETFPNVGLPHNADDETVWQFCQDNRYFLLTGNRSGKDGEEALEAVIRRNYHENVLPVLTISNLKRVAHDKVYRESCAAKLIEIVSDTVEDGKYLGVGRLYLP